jgi:tetratricopeptide (TPR) repeat protein
MTKLRHPKKGDNELWRSDAYDSLETLAVIFRNPRAHTGKGYRTTDQSFRGCIKCGQQKGRIDFSRNQWRKDPGVSKCHDRIEGRNAEPNEAVQNNSAQPEDPYDLSKVSRDCITCDAGCGAVAPTIRCERCHLFYYCSQACESQHYYEHAQDCRHIDDMRERFARYKEPDRNVMRGVAMAKQLAGKMDIESQLLQAEYIYQENGQWEAAFEVYRNLFLTEIEFASPPEQRQVYMGLSRCAYEMQEYDRAIQMGMVALEMNRHFPQAHKYVALAQKAIGDCDAAKATMTRAVLYEAPWDDNNLESNRALLKQMFG